jgi:hypothetical protein
MPKGKKAVPETPEPQIAQAAPEQKGPELAAAQVRQEQQIRDLSGAKQIPVIGPGGGRRDGAKYMGVRVNINNQTGLLGNPSSILKPECRKADVVYCWAKRDNNATTAWIRSGWYTPVAFEEIAALPDAFVQCITMPAGPNPGDKETNYVSWGSLILCTMPLQVWEKIYKAAEEQAWGQQAEMNVSLQDRIERHLGQSGVVTVETKDYARETLQIAASPSPAA